MRTRVWKYSYNTPRGLKCEHCNRVVVEGDIVVHKRVVNVGNWVAHWECLSASVDKIVEDTEKSVDLVSQRLQDAIDGLSRNFLLTPDQAADMVRSAMMGNIRMTDDEVVDSLHNFVEELQNA